MRSPSLHHARKPGSQKLETILAIGFCSSLVLHLGIMLGISNWWKPSATMEEPIEITLVEPVETIAPVKSTPPPIEIAPKPTISKRPSLVIPAPKPIEIAKPPSSTKTVKSTPTPIVIKPKATPKAIRAKSTPSSKPLSPVKIATPKQIGSRSSKTLPTAKSNRIPELNSHPPDLAAAMRDDRSSLPPTKSFSFPISPTPTPSIKSTPTPVNSPLPAKSSPLPNNPSPAPVTSDRATEPIQPTPISPNPIPLTTPATSEIAPNPPPTSNPVSRSSRNLQPPQDPPRSIDNPLTDSNNDRRFKPIENSVGGGLATQPSVNNPANGNSIAPTNPSGDRAATKNGTSTGNPGAVNGTNNSDGKTNGTTGNNSSTGSAGNAGLQCIQNCQIARLQDLQDSDGGKDRLRIRVTIDPNGIVTAAKIAKSSGNAQIDEIVLAGIKQMQFNPSGKPIKGIIRANIFL